MRFLFGEGQIDSSCLYCEGKEPGFITQENMDGKLAIPELNSGMLPAYWSENYKLTHIKHDEHGCYTDGFDEAFIPLVFACDVASEGNYYVNVKVFAGCDIEDGLIFLGRRRLVAKLSLSKGEVYEETFLVNVSLIIPRTYTDPMADTTIDVTIVGEGLHLSAVEISEADVKTVYIAGDSTVTDQCTEYPYLPERSYCGWGQMLSAYLKNQMAVSNHSHSGLTTESFVSEGHYQILKERIKKDDICLIQFGHNDQKLDSLKADEGYKDNLNTYIDEIKAKGAIPVIVTPLARNSWKGNDGSYNDLLSEYARVCIEVCENRDIALVDLHQKSMNFVQSMGCEAAKKYFFPSDFTHSNDFGAYLFASYVYEDLMKQNLVTKTTYTEWIPPVSMREVKIPSECANRSNPNEVVLFENLEREDDLLTRVEAFEMAIVAARFFPTNVYNDMFEDVIGHETYAGSVECAYQNGLIPSSLVEDNKIFPERNITGKQLWEILSLAYKSRRNDPLDEKKILGESFKFEDVITRKEAAEICRKLKI